MNELALFAGAGGGLLASNLLGHNIVCAVERDGYCINVLMQRQNERVLDPFPIWDDICTFDGKPWNGTVDLVSGGFPCQAFSTAARGRNIPEKDLWYEMRRVVREVCPKFVFSENVSERAILQAKKDLEEDGYRCEYIKLSAKDVGADHIRDRFWLLAYSDNYGKLCISEYAEAPMLQELCNGVWETYPGELRVADGVAYRMDRLKAVGNGQVPIVAAVAFLRLMKKLLSEQSK
jgi:DNA (cytosine-5)-methyltransferase 1